jgi:hypothetical protein
MDAISEETKNRIQLEEWYRTEVRDQIQRKKERENRSRSSRLIGFLNSSLGLWMLSAIFVTGAGSAYTQWRTAHEEQQKKETQARMDAEKMKETTERLRLEVGHRISQTLGLLSNLSDKRGRGTLGTGHNIGEVRSVLASFRNGTGQKVAPLYHEFASYSTIGLLTELRRLEPRPDKKNSLDRAIEDLSGLDGLLEVEKAPLSSPKSVAGAILKRFSSILWGDFYYLDCPAEAPFC